MTKAKFNKEEFDKIKCRGVTLEDIQQVMSRAVRPDNSEYPAPTLLERMIPRRLQRKTANHNLADFAP